MHYSLVVIVILSQGVRFGLISLNNCYEVVWVLLNKKLEKTFQDLVKSFCKEIEYEKSCKKITR